MTHASGLGIEKYRNSKSSLSLSARAKGNKAVSCLSCQRITDVRCVTFYRVKDGLYGWLLV